MWGQPKPKIVGKPTVLVVAFAFATPPQATVNGVLRRKVFNLCEYKFQGKAWVYTQPDLATGLDVPNLEVIEEEEGKPSPTLRIARGAVGFAKQIGANEIHIVAAAPHLWRCVRDMKAALHEGNLSLPLGVEHTPEMPFFAWFDKSSSQKRTRSAFAWYRRDLILWCLPYAIYKRFAG